MVTVMNTGTILADDDGIDIEADGGDNDADGGDASADTGTATGGAGGAGGTGGAVDVSNSGSITATDSEEDAIDIDSEGRVVGLF